MKAAGPDVVLQLPWGAMGATLGRLDGQQGASEGPMSFAVPHADQMLVLDQVNERLARFDAKGALIAETPIVAPTIQEFEPWEDDTFVLLDRLVRQSLIIVDRHGGVIREEPIVGMGIPEGGLVSAMIAEPDGIWLEVGHVERVRVLDAQLAPCPRTIRRGRPFSADHNLVAALDGPGAAALWLEHDQTQSVPAKTQVQSARFIARIVWAEIDAGRNVHAMFHQLEYDPVDHVTVTFERVLGVRYDPWLREVGRFTSSRVIRRWEQFREFRVEPDGTTYQMAFDANGVTFLRWRWM
ncbi:MAG: hypothetical protein JRI23_12005 [Deltaproteobacteria bacterium]|jgi:hypothetical protein|nr:hypothetical protein [Deltaproteobacteria bacterium]MBW2532432.1 hypothetical protein [Deltaproteobacteria bacterium]